MRREEGTLGKDIALMGSQREPLRIVSLWTGCSKGALRKNPKKTLIVKLSKEASVRERMANGRQINPMGLWKLYSPKNL